MAQRQLRVLVWMVWWLGWTAWVSAAPFAYISNSDNGGTVSVIDTATNTIVANVRVRAPTGVAVHPKGTRVYVATHGISFSSRYCTICSNAVAVIDTATNSVVATVPSGGVEPTGVAVNSAGTRVYVTNRGDGTVGVIDTVTNTLLSTGEGFGDTVTNSLRSRVGGFNFPFGVAVHPAGTRVYVTTDRDVSVIDTATNTVIARVSVSAGSAGGGAAGVAVHPDGTRVYVAISSARYIDGIDRRSNLVAVLDATTNTVIGTVPLTTSDPVLSPVPVAGSPAGIAVSPDGRRVYVTAQPITTGLLFLPNGFVSVIDAATNTVIATKPVGQAPSGIAVTPDGKRVYVANAYSTADTVSVIDTTTNTVVDTLVVGLAPFALGQFIVPSLLSDIQPSAGGDCGAVSAVIHGQGFVPGATINLVTSGQPDIPGASVQTAPDGLSLAITFDLTGQPQGTRDVVVTNPDGTTLTLAWAFTIEACRPPQVSVAIAGRNAILQGRPQTFTLVATNRGNVNGIGAPTVAGIPTNAIWQLDFPPPPILGGTLVPWDQLQIQVVTDQEIALPLPLTVVPPGSTIVARFRLTLPVVVPHGTIQLHALWFGP